MVFGVKLEISRKFLKGIIGPVSRQKGEGEDDLIMLADDLLLGTIMSVTWKVKELKPSVDSLAIFIDESVRLVEALNRGRCLNADEDAYFRARRLILGDKVGALANTVLVMTALAVSPLGITDSDRPIVPLVLPGALDVNKIAHEIFAPRIELLKRSLSRGDEVVLFALARFVHRAPRLTQLMAESIESILANPAAQLTDSLTIDKLLELFEEKRRDFYPCVTFPKGRHLHALLVGEAIEVDECVDPSAGPAEVCW
jgi:hypothetical protein